MVALLLYVFGQRVRQPPTLNHCSRAGVFTNGARAARECLFPPPLWTYVSPSPQGMRLLVFCSPFLALMPGLVLLGRAFTSWHHRILVACIALACARSGALRAEAPLIINHPHSSHPLPLRPPVLKDSASRQRAGRRRTRSPTTPGRPTRSSGFISPSSVRATSPPSVLSRATRTRSHCAWRCSLRSGSRWRSACRSASTATPPTPPSSVRAPRSSRAGSWGASHFKVG